MNAIKVIGIDLAKSVFQVCVWMNERSIAFNRKVSRAKLLVFASFHYRGHTFSQWDISSDLFPSPHTPKSINKSPEKYANDALAICETALRPDIHFLAVKTMAHSTWPPEQR